VKLLVTPTVHDGIRVPKLYDLKSYRFEIDNDEWKTVDVYDRQTGFMVDFHSVDRNKFTWIKEEEK